MRGSLPSIFLASVALLLQARQAHSQVVIDGRPHRIPPPPGLLQAAADLLEFRWESSTPLAIARFIDPERRTPVALSDSVVLDMAGIDSAWKWPSFHDSLGRWDVGVRLSRDGAARFGATTATHVGQRLAVIVDGRVTEMPIVMTALGSRTEVASRVSDAAADSLVSRLNSMVVALRPYLPARLH